MMKKTVTQEVTSIYAGDFPRGKAEILLFWQNLLANIPDDCAESARLELIIEEDYGSSCVLYLTLSYQRPETPKEQSRRELCEDMQKEARRVKELSLLKELLEKYSNGEGTHLDEKR